MVVHISLLIICVILLLLPDNVNNRRKRIIFPICAIAVIIFAAIRYDYGLDYWSYYESFRLKLAQNYRSLTGEPFFYRFMMIFPTYMSFVAVQSIIVFGIFFWLVKKYVHQNYYWLVFFLLLSVGGLYSNLVSALRCSSAAAIIWYASYNFAIKNNRLFLYLVCCAIATLFHTTAAIFAVIPLIDLFIKRVGSFNIFIVLVATLVVGFLLPEDVFQYVMKISSLSEGYLDHYAAEQYNLRGIIAKGILLIPAYFIFAKRSQNEVLPIFIYSSCFLFLFLNFIGLNIQSRYTLYLYIFMIIAIGGTLPLLTKAQKYYMLVPLVLLSIYSLFSYYEILQTNYIGIEGNPLFYHTIFSAPNII